jgi:hypothetical protein
MKALLPRKESVTKFEHTFRLQIGSICCELRCNDAEIHQKLQMLYRNYLTDTKSDITVELEVISRMSTDKLSSVLTRSRYMRHGNNFRSSGKLLKGQYDLDSRTVKITGEKALVNPDNKFNLLNQLISMSYYSACKMKYNTNPPAMLIHACGIIRNGQALIFAGPCEVGKTTIARLCSERHGEVFNDEILLMSRPGSNGNGVIIQNTPILGDFPPGRNAEAPLRCICMLKQNNRTAWRYLSKAEAYLRFMRQIIGPSCVGNYDKRTAYSIMADFSSEVVQAIPVYELEFNMDSNTLWRITDELEGIPRTESLN